MSFNLAVILRETALASPGRPAILYPGGSLTYAELDGLSDLVAAGLQASGVRPGDAVALQLPNVPEFVVSYFAILKAGGVAVPVNTMLKAPEAAFILGDSAAKILITWGSVLDHALTGAVSAGVSEIYSVGGNDERAIPFDRLLAVPTPSAQLAARKPDDTAVIMYTSGTTGQPKGAELTHLQLYMNADIPGRLFDVQSADVVITVLPLFHVFGLSSILNVCVRFGCTMSLIPRFDPAVVLEAIQRDRATIFEGVPAMFISLLSYPDLNSHDISSLRVAISGGASIPADVLDAFEKRFGIPVLEGYGLTETASTVTFNKSASDRRIYSVGKPIWGTETEIWGEDGKALPPGKDNVGEVVTRGLHVMKGYLNHAEATAGAFAGGWFHTGDLGYFDENGFLFIVGRAKGLIIRGGYNVYPLEIENVLRAHPAVADVAVIGIPHERVGEEVMAVVVPCPGTQVTAPELTAFCKERLAAYKYPRVIEFRAELPKNTLGKVLKNKLLPADVRSASRRDYEGSRP